jgi:hypothetical protein
MILWPEVLPQYLQVSGFSEQLADQLIRTQMDAGPAKARRRFTAAPRPLTGDIIVTAAQLAFFRTWYASVIMGGSLRFGWVEPGGTPLANLLTNGGFDSATTGWVAGHGTLSSVTGGIFGNCLQIDFTESTAQYADQVFTTVVGHEYLLSGYVKSGTSGNESFYAQIQTNPEGVGIIFYTGTSAASWAYFYDEFTSTQAQLDVSVAKYSGTAGNMLFDQISIVDITSGISEMRFIEPPVITAHGVEYRISMKLEILP